MAYRIVKLADRMEDSWTYGDWTQFIIQRPDGKRQCARHSSIPWLMAVLGMLLLGFVALSAVASLVAFPVMWDRVLKILLVGLVLFIPLALEFATGRRLMVTVGLPFIGKPGSDHRVFP